MDVIPCEPAGFPSVDPGPVRMVDANPCGFLLPRMLLADFVASSFVGGAGGGGGLPGDPPPQNPSKPTGAM
jgi:hypothetical protein